MRLARSPSEYISQKPKHANLGRVPVIMPFLNRSKEILAKKSGIKQLPHLVARPAWIYGCRVAVVDPGVGAPSAVLSLEETFHQGHRDFLFFGACGGITAESRIGDIVLPEAAISEEGTSPLYVRSGSRFEPDSRLTTLLEKTASDRDADVNRGPVWTTDAPYRETPAKIRRYRRLGAIAVDMETSALFAVARLRGARVAGLLVVSDLLHDEWVIGWHRKTYDAAEDKARDIIVKTATQLSGCKKT